ncbi:MAG: glycosyltransferase family 4 protein [Rhodothermales bacterium]
MPRESIPHRPSSAVFLVPGFPKDEEDTSCLPAIQNYVAAFAEAHLAYQTHVIAFQYPFARRIYPWKKATVHALAGKNKRRLGRIRTWLRAAAAFLHLRKKTDIRVLHSFWLTECTWVGRWLCRLFRIRHVASIGGQDARADNPYLKHLNLNGVIVTAGSSFAARTFTTSTGRAVDHIIPLGLDTAHLLEIEPPALRDIDVLGVGSLIPLKDYATFIDIVAHLISPFPALKTCIIGDGPEQAALQQHIEEKGLRRHVMLAGAMPRDEVFRHMLRSKVFLHTSRYESQGYVFLEALFAGLPVVCFDVGYTGKLGRVVRCQNRQAMIDAVAMLLREPPASNRTPVASVDDTVRAFEALYFGTARTGPRIARHA